MFQAKSKKLVTHNITRPFITQGERNILYCSRTFRDHLRNGAHRALLEKSPNEEDGWLNEIDFQINRHDQPVTTKGENSTKGHFHTKIPIRRMNRVMNGTAL
jgi:hypothetical protein